MTAILTYLCHSVISMPTITIYLTKEQYDKVCDAPSKAVQAALDYYFKNADLGKDFVQSEQSD